MLRKLCLLISLVLLVCMTSTAGAAIVHWTGNLNTVFENPNNWDLGTVPGFDDDALIDPAGGKPAPNFTTTSTNPQPIVLLSVGYAGTSGTMNMSSGTLTCNCAFVGTKTGKSGADATVTMTGGTIKVTGIVNTGAGTVICNQGYLQWPRGNAGSAGTGTFTMSGGLVDVGCLDLPYTDSTGTGIFNLNGGTLYVRPTNAADKISPTGTEGGLFIGEPRTRDANLDGTLNIAGGTLLVTGDVTALITKYVDVNGVIVPYPSGSGNKYIVSDYGNRNDGKTTVTAVASPANQAWDPDPIDGHKYAPKAPTLTWSAGSGATSHDVYFGTAASPPLIGNQTGTSYVPGTLVLGRTYYWKITEQPGSVVGAIWSFTVEGKARNPNPTSGASKAADTSGTVNLSWTPGAYSSTHAVYFGTNSASIPIITSPSQPQSPNNVDVDPALGVTSYWRVDEVNGATTVTGDVWNFAMANYLLVEDYESYNTGNLSGVWNPVGSDLTITLSTLSTGLPVNSGSNAMRVQYDLNGSYDQVEGDYGSGQDWTSGTTGTTALSLWLRGTGNNDAIDSISVYLRDSDGDLSDKASVSLSSVLYNESWMNVNIATSAFGDGPGDNFSLAAVQYVGIELDASTKGAVSGVIYVDDWRLYPSRCVPDKDITYSGKAATADITEDCKIDNNDLDVIAEDWLNADSSPEPDGILTNFVGDSNWVAGKFSNALKFDGVNDWVDVDDLAFSDFAGKTISLWFKTTAFPTGNNSYFLFGTSKEWRANISVTSDSLAGTTSVGARIGNAFTEPAVIGSTVISNGTWYHVALTLSAADGSDNVTGKLYVNGAQAGSAAIVNPSHYYDSLQGGLRGACIGSMNNGLQQFANATIDDFRIYNTELTDVGSPSDIDKLADNDVVTTNPAATPLILYAFNEAAGTSAEQDGSIASVYHPVGYVVTQYGKTYTPIDISDAELYSSEAAGSRKINFKDHAKLATYWLYTIPNWP